MIIHIKWNYKPLVLGTGPKTAATIIRTSYFLKIDCGILINDIGDRDQGIQNRKQ